MNIVQCIIRVIKDVLDNELPSRIDLGHYRKFVKDRALGLTHDKLVVSLPYLFTFLASLSILVTFNNSDILIKRNILALSSFRVCWTRWAFSILSSTNNNKMGSTFKRLIERCVGSGFR